MARGKQLTANKKSKAARTAQKRSGRAKTGTAARSTVKKMAKINAVKRKRVQAGINKTLRKK